MCVVEQIFGYQLVIFPIPQVWPLRRKSALKFRNLKSHAKRSLRKIQLP